MKDQNNIDYNLLNAAIQDLYRLEPYGCEDIFNASIRVIIRKIQEATNIEKHPLLMEDVNNIKNLYRK
jgi:hypothetical protein